jgi:hypothetical protein
MTVFTTIKRYFQAMSLLCCFTLYAIGQIWLFITDRKEEEFYDVVTKHTGNWVNAHLVLMLSLLFMIPAYDAIRNHLSGSKHLYWADLNVFFTCIWVFVLFGQFTIDLCIVEIFTLPQEQAYAMLDKLQANYIIKALFYDNSKLFFLFKIFDLAMLAQISLGIAMIVSRKIPKWAWILFFVTLVLTTFSILIHPVYGRIIKRLSYALFSVSFLPVAISLIRKPKLLDA